MKHGMTARLAAGLGCLLLLAGAVLAAELPRAQLDESERYYTAAYELFLDRAYWGALDYLDRALRANTYLVDYYLLRGLTMARIGDYGEGREALAYYMEVRPMDVAAPRILSNMIGQQRGMRGSAGAAALSARWRFSAPDLQTELELGSFRPYNIRGLGKADAWGSALVLSDTLGDGVYFHSRSMRGVQKLRIESPAVTLPMGDSSFWVLTVSGDVFSFTAFTDDPALLSPDRRGAIDSTVADAAVLSSGEFAAADPAAREVVFYSFETFARGGTWAPPEDGELSGVPDTPGAPLFEPVALAAYGPWLAVADRGGEKIFFVDAVGRREFFSVPVPRPRDVAWSALGELFVIGEGGDLYRLPVDFRSRRVETADVMVTEVENGWTLFTSPAGDVYCMDIGVSRLWKGEPVPDIDTSLGFLSVCRPRIEREEDKESFVLEAVLASPFVSYSKSAGKVVHAVWNNRTIPSFAEWRGDAARKTFPLLFQRPAPVGTVTPALRSVAAENGTDIQIALPSIWDTEREGLTHILIDSTLLFSQDELDTLAFFCLNNGLELDVWARTVPTVEMVRTSAFTGGRVIPSLTNVPDLSPPDNRMEIRVPLPRDLSSSGYPSRSMLTVYLDVGLMHTKNWIPLWPDLLE
ncbi:MAG: hypothetical protein LBO82_00390 [Synergistaceae bacterium]|jgi:hypothetical protein|nr:hypothetical protein [Synergistaceae bacterium]